jgi:hypothetical protein
VPTDLPPVQHVGIQRESSRAPESCRCTRLPSDAGYASRLPVNSGVAMRRTSWITAGTLLFVAVLAGCREGADSPVAPTSESPSIAAPAPISLAPQGRPTLDLAGGSADSASVDFVVGAAGGIFFTGNHAVVFPAQSVCDPATSSYGPTTWDEPCTPLQTQLKVHAEVRRKDGTTWVDFTPSLRFVPSQNPSKWVWMFMYSPEAIGSTDLSRFNILWAESIGGKTVDEVPTDVSLRTYVDSWQGISIRRIKHFSGYALAGGRSCNPGEECGEGGGGGTP